MPTAEPTFIINAVRRNVVFDYHPLAIIKIWPAQRLATSDVLNFIVMAALRYVLMRLKGKALSKA